jgi:hypothetical protein
MHLPVDDGEHQLQVLCDPRSPALMQLLGHAGAAQRAAGMSRLVLHALIRLLRSEDRLTVGEGDAHAFPDPARLLTRKRENVAQERWPIRVPWWLQRGCSAKYGDRCRYPSARNRSPTTMPPLLTEQEASPPYPELVVWALSEKARYAAQRRRERQYVL